MNRNKFYAITRQTKSYSRKSERKALVQSPEVAEYQKGQLVYYLRSVGQGKNRKLMRYPGYVEKPLYTQVLTWWCDTLGCWHQDKIKPEKLEKRIE